MLKRNILFILFILSAYISKGQETSFIGTPEIQNYSFETYKASPQNWSIAQDSVGRMYFGNNFGLLQFNGSDWELYPLQKQSILRSICLISDKKIAIGGQGEFGYFYVKDSDLKYKNLYQNSFPKLNFVDVWRTFKQHDTLFYFLDRNKIVYVVNDSITKIEIPNAYKKFRGFQIQNKIYIVDEKEGLAIVQGKKIIGLNQLKKQAKYKVYSLLKSPKNEFVVITATNGIYRKTNLHNWEKVNTGYNSYLTDNYPYSAIYLRDGNLLITTLLGGVVLLDKNLKIRKILSSDNGLSSNGVYGAFQDKENDIWLATENGISYINYSSPLRKFTKKDGLNGSIKEIKYYNKTLYIGTYNGLYILNKSKISLVPAKKKISLLSKKYYFISDFQVFKSPYTTHKSLFATALRNLIEIKGQKIFNKENLYSSEKILQVPHHEKYFVASQNHGIYIYKIINDKFNIKQLGKLYAFDYETKYLAFDKKGNLWAEIPREGLAIIHVNNYEQLEYESKVFNDKNGLPNKDYNRPFFVDSQVVVATNNGLYGLKDSTAQIVDYTFKPLKLWNLDFDKDSLIIDNIFTVGKQKWFMSNKGFFYLDSNQKIFEPFYPLNTVKTETDITAEKTNLIWLASHTIVYAFNPLKKVNNAIKRFPLINSITMGNKKLQLHFSNLQKDSCCSKLHIGKFAYKDNTVSINFSIPYYRYVKEIKYCFFLRGYDKKWSSYQKSDNIRYTNLPYGKYAFHVKATNIYHKISKETILYFEIKRPWYLSFWAYLLYLTLIIFLILGVIEQNARRLVQRNQILENLVKKRTAKIYSQKEEIRAQSEQLKSQAEILELSNNELKQLSMVAKSTSNSVVILDEKGNIEWWNTGFTQFFQYKFNKYQGSNFNKIKNKIRPDIIKALKYIDETHKPVIYTTKDNLENNTSIWYQTNITPVYNDNGSIFRYVVVDVDITPIKKAEREIYSQKYKLEKQRDKISLQNKEMTSSIEYASRIQRAMLPLEIFLKSVFFDNYFVLNLPRDIVSGDFYWVNVHRRKIYIAVADCTGHGIPGSFLSLLGISYLNNIIQRSENNDIMPDEVLNRLREHFIISLHQRGKAGENQDGMDIALISLDYEKMEMYFAGANNSIYFFEKNREEIQEMKADKMPIGIHINKEDPFSLTTRKFAAGETIYLFSDGYKDQFGGEFNKKFMTKRFKKMLTNVHNNPLDYQKQVLSEIFYEWKAKNEQVDDILVFGLRT